MDSNALNPQLQEVMRLYEMNTDEISQRYMSALQNIIAWTTNLGSLIYWFELFKACFQSLRENYTMFLSKTYEGSTEFLLVYHKLWFLSLIHI